MTFSIAARDPDTGELGVAVQTRWFNVGAVVPWAEPGVGAVATQSFAEISYGPKGLALMRDGAPAAEGLERMRAEDEGRETRQVAMVDAAGTVAVFTGSGCVAEAGSATGEGVTAQANMMERATVWDAMLGAYEGGAGDLADRLMAALRAAEAEGGDMRGRQSAALVVVPAEGDPWARRFDLRVEDHRDPVGELARVLTLARAYEHLGRGWTSPGGCRSPRRSRRTRGARAGRRPGGVLPGDDARAERPAARGPRGDGPCPDDRAPMGPVPVADRPQRPRPERPRLPGAIAPLDPEERP